MDLQALFSDINAEGMGTKGKVDELRSRLELMLSHSQELPEVLVDSPAPMGILRRSSSVPSLASSTTSSISASPGGKRVRFSAEVVQLGPRLSSSLNTAPRGMGAGASATAAAGRPPLAAPRAVGEAATAGPQSASVPVESHLESASKTGALRSRLQALWDGVHRPHNHHRHHKQRQRDTDQQPLAGQERDDTDTGHTAQCSSIGSAGGSGFVGYATSPFSGNAEDKVARLRDHLEFMLSGGSFAETALVLPTGGAASCEAPPPAPLVSQPSSDAGSEASASSVSTLDGATILI